MAYSPSSPVTGAAQTGFTSPTYTLTSTGAPDNNGVQHAVTAIGGTQTGVTVSSVSSPFTVTFWRPKAFKALRAVNPVTGNLEEVPRNVWKLIIRKGVTPLAGQPTTTAQISMSIEVPAGSDSYDPANVRAMLSLAAGLLSQQSSGIGDSLVTGVA